MDAFAAHMTRKDTMKLFSQLKHIGVKDRALFGGKTISLVGPEMLGLPIPDGFAISSAAFTRYVRFSPEFSHLFKNLLESCDSAVTTTIGASIANKILSLKLPVDFIEMAQQFFGALECSLVAVRSSAPEEDDRDHSWAGQFESALGVKADNLIPSILYCWASAFSARAIAYRIARGLSLNDISMAILVQRMIPAEHSGVAFSKDPICGDNILIESVFGLGESLVSGHVTPTRYSIDKQSGTTLSTCFSSQGQMLVLSQHGKPEWRTVTDSCNRELSSSVLSELVRYLLHIERAWGQPVDMEWCVEGGQVQILQARPITPGLLAEETEFYQQIQHLRGQFHFSWAECHPIISAENWPATLLSHSHTPGCKGTTSFVFSDHGYISSYFYADDREIALEEGRTLCTPEGFRRYLEASSRIQRSWQHLSKAWNSHLNRTRSVLLYYYKEYQQLFDETYALYRMSQPECSDALADALRARLAELPLTSLEQQKHFIELSAGVEHDIVQEEEMALLRLLLTGNTDQDSLHRHCRNFPWLLFNTFDPAAGITFLRQRIEDLDAFDNHQLERKLQELENQPKKAAEQKTLLLNSISDENITHLSYALGSLAVDRYRLKGLWAGAEFLFLELFSEIAAEAGLPIEELFESYRSQEIIALLADGKIVQADNRKARQDYFAVLVHNGELIWKEGKQAEILHTFLIPPTNVETSQEIRGTIAHIGMAQGKVRKISVRGLAQLLLDLSTFQPGEVLVTTMTQPTMIPLARRAAAIVTNEGGATSHAAIIARELGIPCIVGTQIATEVLVDGDEVLVDAFQGVVRRIHRGLM